MTEVMLRGTEQFEEGEVVEVWLMDDHGPTEDVELSSPG